LASENELPLLHGEADGVGISFKNYPVREATDPKQIRKAIYNNFNYELIRSVFDHMGDLDAFIRRAQLGPVTLNHMIDRYRIPCEIKVQKSISKNAFKSAVPDAIISAFKNENIGR
jgi:hypothetical protein